MAFFYIRNQSWRACLSWRTLLYTNLIENVRLVLYLFLNITVLMPPSRMVRIAMDQIVLKNRLLEKEKIIGRPLFRLRWISPAHQLAAAAAVLCSVLLMSWDGIPWYDHVYPHALSSSSRGGKSVRQQPSQTTASNKKNEHKLAPLNYCEFRSRKAQGELSTFCLVFCRVFLPFILVSCFCRVFSCFWRVGVTIWSLSSSHQRISCTR